MSPQVQSFLALLIPIIVAVGTVPAFNAIKKASAWVNSLPDPAKQAVVMLWAGVANILVSVIPGLNLPPTLAGMNTAAVGTALTTVLAYLLHLASTVSSVKATQAIASPAATKAAAKSA